MWENIRGPRPGFWKSKLIARLTYHHIYIRTCRICKTYLSTSDLWLAALSTKLNNASLTCLRNVCVCLFLNKESRLFKTSLKFGGCSGIPMFAAVDAWFLLPASSSACHISRVRKGFRLFLQFVNNMYCSHWPRQTMWPDNWHLIGHWSKVYASFVDYEEMNLKA